MGIRGGRTCLPLFEVSQKEQRTRKGSTTERMVLHITAFGYCLYHLSISYLVLQRFELHGLTPPSACLYIHYCDIPLAVVTLSLFLKLFVCASASASASASSSFSCA
jgi:hypothetical protein